MVNTKVILVVGPLGSGKTSLIHRYVRGTWFADPVRTIGLDMDAGKKAITDVQPNIIDELRAVMPPDGLELEFWEIGGKGGHLRCVPRGRPVDGILLCYDVSDRGSFQTAAHLLMQHRTDRHFRYHSAAVVARDKAPPRLAAVLCGTKVDEADASKSLAVSSEEAQRFAKANGIQHAVVTSSKTGEGVAAAFQALAAAIIAEEEDAEAERLVAARAPGPTVEMWALGSSSPSSRKLNLTSPRGLRPNEPERGAAARHLVEIVDSSGVPYGARPLAVCLARGLLHRAVHVWIYDAGTGGLLLRKYSPHASKHPTRWGPTGHGEVLCYETARTGSSGPHTSELSTHAATRSLQEQLGVELAVGDLEHWFSCISREENNHEYLDVYVTPVPKGHFNGFRMLSTEEIEWVHFTDVFGPEAKAAGTMMHIEPEYRQSMVHRMKTRILHAHADSALPKIDLAYGRPHCPLPIAASFRLA